MTLETRRPTGLPSWPMFLVAGIQGGGKSWSIAQASSSALVDRTLWLTLGELDPDEYGSIPGADFEIVRHDGTYGSVVRAFREIAALPQPNGKPHLLAFDSSTKLWDLIVDNVQQIANERAKGRKTASGDYAISPDLWNVAKGQWEGAMDAIRSHRGPSIITARLDEVMVMEDGQPTKERRWKVQAHKSLVFDADVIVELHERGHALLTKVKSVQLQLDKPVILKDFAIAGMWDRMGIKEGSEVGEKAYSMGEVEAADLPTVTERWRVKALAATSREELTQVWQDAQREEVPLPVLDAIRKIAGEFGQTAPEPLPASEPENVQPRAWLDEAKDFKYSEQAAELLREATALNANKRITNALELMASRLPARPAEAEPEAGWAPVAPDSDAAAVLDESIEAGAKA